MRENGRPIDPLIAAITPPSFAYRGRFYQGRILSFAEGARFAAKFREFEHTDPTDAYRMVPVVRDYLDAVFPRPWWRVWQPRVSTLILRLPPAVMWELLRDFFACQASASSTTARHAEAAASPSMSPGPTSSTSIPGAPMS